MGESQGVTSRPEATLALRNRRKDGKVYCCHIQERRTFHRISERDHDSEVARDYDDEQVHQFSPHQDQDDENRGSNFTRTKDDQNFNASKGKSVKFSASIPSTVLTTQTQRSR